MTAAVPARVRLVVADDHLVVRTGFAALLDTQPDFLVVGTAEDGADAVRICQELRPDVVLMDVRMPGMDGIEATRQLEDPAAGGPRVLILTTFDLDEYVYDALRAGASGFLLKDVTAERLFEAVRVIADGDALLHARVDAAAAQAGRLQRLCRCGRAPDQLPSAIRQDAGRIGNRLARETAAQGRGLLGRLPDAAVTHA